MSSTPSAPINNTSGLIDCIAVENYASSKRPGHLFLPGIRRLINPVILISDVCAYHSIRIKPISARTLISRDSKSSVVVTIDNITVGCDYVDVITRFSSKKFVNIWIPILNSPAFRDPLVKLQ